MKILFFIGSLGSGGKERRLVELLTYLKQKNKYDILVLLAYNEIAYPQFKTLGIHYVDLQKKPQNKDISVFFKIHKIIKEFKPDIIHTWGGMQTFYMLPASIYHKIPLINSQITNAPPMIKLNLFSSFVNYCNFKFSTIILANSYAGLRAYKMDTSPKAKVIYNGMNMHRFNNLMGIETIKNKYNIITKYAIVMVASYSKNKDFDRFYKVAKYVTLKEKDITFIAVGGIPHDTSIHKKMIALTTSNIIFHGPSKEVESLVNACDVGILFSTQGEGISNAILEYMALGKTVIVDECGGTPEYVKEGENGFFTTNRSIEKVGDLIIDIINQPQRRKRIGNNAIKTIQTMFTLEQMGKEFEMLYHNVLDDTYKNK